MTDSNEETNKKEQDSNRIEEITEKIKLFGITIDKLLNPKFIEKMAEKKINFIPFLIGLSIGNENIVLINHHSPDEINSKILHIESRFESKEKKVDIETISNIIKELGE